MKQELMKQSLMMEEKIQRARKILKELDKEKNSGFEKAQRLFIIQESLARMKKIKINV